MNIPSTSFLFSKVHNRGIPPEEFLESLVKWARQADPEIFSPEYGTTKERDIYDDFEEWWSTSPRQAMGMVEIDLGDLLIRRAFMCEVLRVLAGFESSWNWDEGVDKSNPDSDTLVEQEAGIFQISSNSMNFDQSLKDCTSRYTDPGKRMSYVQSLEPKRFIFTMKDSLRFPFEYCARLLRFTVRHHGPLVRREVFQWMSPAALQEFVRLLTDPVHITTTTHTESLGGEDTNIQSIPKSNNTMAPVSSTKEVIVIDPGHGGADSGAVSRGHMEKTIVFQVSNILADLLRNDGRFAVLLTRNNDTFVELSERARIANAVKGSLISIHCNAGGGVGFECFTTPGQTISDKLATSCIEQYKKSMSHFLGFPLRADMKDGDPDKEARFTVLTGTTGAAILFELGFMDSKDLDILTDESAHKIMARALYLGILDWKGWALSGNPIPASAGGVTTAPTEPIAPVPPAPPVLPTPAPVPVANPADPLIISAEWLEAGAKAIEGVIIPLFNRDRDEFLVKARQIVSYEDAAKALRTEAAARKTLNP